MSAFDRKATSHRLYCALVLPLDSRFEVDEPGLRGLVRYFMANPEFRQRGGLVANSEAGEIFTLTRAERRRTLEIILDACSGQVPVIAGSFGLSTADAVQCASDAKAAGAKGIFVLPPAGSQDVGMAWDAVQYPEVWLDLIKAQDQAADLPVFTHPVVTFSQPWGYGLPLETTLKYCREVPNIVGWKMTYAYLGNRLLSRAMREHAPQVALLAASGHFFHEFLATGYLDGTITGSWNYGMEPMLAHMAAWQRNDANAARDIWNSGLARLHEYMYAEPSRLHVRYKIAAWLRGLIDSPRMRPPMPAPRPQETRRLAELLAAAGFELPPDRERAAAETAGAAAHA